MNSNEVLAILGDLVAFPSVTPNDAGSLKYIEDIIIGLGGKCIRVDRNQTTNLIATIGKGQEVFAYAGHVDVVPSGDVTKWVHNPFELYLDGDKIIGRGVADMKGSIAAFLVALKEFVQKADLDKYQIMLLLTSDEEGSAIDGTLVMVEYLKKQSQRLNYCLVGEPSCVDRLGDTIKVGRRGSLTGSLTIKGRQGHIAYPHLCVNPIHKALPVLSELNKVSWDNGNEYFPATSLQFVNLNSGLGVSNVIPGELTANFNFRYNNIHQADELKKKTEEIFNLYDVDYSITWNHSAKPFLTKVAKMVDVAKAAIKEETEITTELKTDGGTSDGRFLIEISDELIELGLKNDSIHQVNESTTIADLQQLTTIYYKILCKVFNA
jgi:succinyl-diaminopimelate desuccinylase